MSTPTATLTRSKLVPTAAASAHTGIPVYRLRELARQGMPCVHVGRKLYYDLEKCDAWIARNLSSGDASATPAPASTDPEWVAAQVAKFSADDLRRAGELLLALANTASASRGAA